MAFLDKIIDAVGFIISKPLDVKSSKIVAGLEVDKTNRFLNELAKCVQEKKPFLDAVDKVRKGQKPNADTLTVDNAANRRKSSISVSKTPSKPSTQSKSNARKSSLKPTPTPSSHNSSAANSKPSSPKPKAEIKTESVPIEEPKRQETPEILEVVEPLKVEVNEEPLPVQPAPVIEAKPATPPILQLAEEPKILVENINVKPESEPESITQQQSAPILDEPNNDLLDQLDGLDDMDDDETLASMNQLLVNGNGKTNEVVETVFTENIESTVDNEQKNSFQQTNTDQVERKKSSTRVASALKTSETFDKTDDNLTNNSTLESFSFAPEPSVQESEVPEKKVKSRRLTSSRGNSSLATKNNLNEQPIVKEPLKLVMPEKKSNDSSTEPSPSITSNKSPAVSKRGENRSQPPPPATPASARPTTSRRSARPTSSRPAPPRVATASKNALTRVLVDSRLDQVPLDTPVGSKLSTGQPSSRTPHSLSTLIGNEDIEEDDADNDQYVINTQKMQDTIFGNGLDENDSAKFSFNPSGDDNRGKLVQQLMETKTELEGNIGNNQRRTSVLDPSSSSTLNQSDSVRLRENVQHLCQSIGTLSKALEYLHEDVDPIKQELEKWRTEYQQNIQTIDKMKAETAKLLEPLERELSQVENEIKEFEEKYSILKGNVYRNNLTVQKMIENI